MSEIKGIFRSPKDPRYWEGVTKNGEPQKKGLKEITDLKEYYKEKVIRDVFFSASILSYIRQRILLSAAYLNILLKGN